MPLWIWYPSLLVSHQPLFHHSKHSRIRTFRILRMCFIVLHTRAHNARAFYAREVKKGRVKRERIMRSCPSGLRQESRFCCKKAGLHVPGAHECAKCEGAAYTGRTSFQPSWLAYVQIWTALLWYGWSVIPRAHDQVQPTFRVCVCITDHPYLIIEVHSE